MYKVTRISDNDESYLMANHKKDAMRKACFLLRTFEGNIGIEYVKKEQKRPKEA